MIERYTRPAMGALWTEDAKLERWLEVELALLEVLEARGEIPAGTAAQVRAKATRRSAAHRGARGDARP